MKATLLLLMIATPFISFISAAAEEYRIATVDLNRLLNQSKGAIEEKKKFEAITNKKRKEIDDKRSSVELLEKELAQKSISRDSKEADSLRAQARDLARLIKDTEEDLKSKYLKSTKNLMKDIISIVEKHAEEQRISLVIDKSEGVHGPILYRNVTLDITEDVLKQLDQ